MIYITTFYLAIVFTALIISMSIAFKVIIFIRNNNRHSDQDFSEDFTERLPRIDLKITAAFIVHILFTMLFMSLFLGWKIVYKALFYDDFITTAAFKIYIKTLLEVKNGL